MRRMLREYVGDMSRTPAAVLDSLHAIYRPLEQVGGPNRVYDIDSTGQHSAIYTVGEDAALAIAWSEDGLVDTIYWWDHFNFGEPDYALDLPQGIDVEKLVPQIKHAVATKQMGQISA